MELPVAICPYTEFRTKQCSFLTTEVIVTIIAECCASLINKVF